MCNRWYGKPLRLCDHIADLLNVCCDWRVCAVMQRQKITVPSPQGGVSPSWNVNSCAMQLNLTQLGHFQSTTAGTKGCLYLAFLVLFRPTP